MIRRGPASGRFLPTATADRLPLFVRPAKSAPHVRGWAKRKAAWIALRDATTARLRAGQ
jgi:hypothetical protein